MASVRVHKPNGMLFFDFSYQGKRCREYTLVPDSPTNRKKLERVVTRIEAEIKAGSFVYENYFPNSKAGRRFAPEPAILAQAHSSPLAPAEAVEAAQPQEIDTPLFPEFANQWFDEHSIEWRRSHLLSLRSTLESRLIPHFREKEVGTITKSDVLKFRADLAKVPGRGGRESLSPKRINEIVGLLSQIMEEAADRFGFSPPTQAIKRLKVRRTDVDPFSLLEVQSIIDTVRQEYKDYFTVRFFTGMRTGEVHGLKWKYIDFDRRLILVRETFVLGEDEYTKTDGSQRDIQMSQPVVNAMRRQFDATGKRSDYVFCNQLGQPLDNKNFTDRVWYPLLRYLDLKQRRPYQMRHTAATLWLAAGEAPEWIARQLGHTSVASRRNPASRSRHIPATLGAFAGHLEAG